MKKGIRIRQWDWLLVIGAVLAPMTGLRIWKIGPAEVLCFIWSIRFIKKGKFIGIEYVKFFAAFLFSMFIGTLIGSVVAPSELGIGGWATWLFLAIFSCTLITGISKNSLTYNDKLFDTICTLSVVWYVFLYIYSKVISKTFLGAPIWYYHRFSGGATNPHQLSILLCCIVFWFTRRLLRRDRTFTSIVCFIATVFLENETDSSTGTVAIALGLFVLLVLYTTTYVKDKHKRKIFVFLELLMGIFVALLFYEVLFNAVYEWIAGDANGLGRFNIWSSFEKVLIKSPIFGLGPGTHAISASGGTIEFHNSYLEICASSGIAGFVAFIRLTMWKLKTVYKGDKFLLPILVSAYGYSLAGFAFRRLIYWIILTFTVVIAKQIIKESSRSSQQNTDNNGFISKKENL